MEIIKLTKENESKWERYVDNNPNSTIYHKIGWKNSVEKSYGHKSFYYMAVENSAVKGILPLFLIKSKIFGTKLVSVPFGYFGGIIADNEAKELLINKAKDITKELNANYLELKNIQNSYGFDATKTRITSVIELDEPKILFNNFEKDKRKGIKKAQKNGLKAEWNIDGLDDFYEVLLVNMKSLGSPTHHIDFFKNLVDELKDYARILLIRYNDKAIHGSFSFFYKDTIYRTWSSSLKEFRKLYASNLSIWETIQQGYKLGFKYCNLGTSHVGSGNYLFKKGFRAEDKEVYHQYLSYNGDKVPDTTDSNLKRRLFAKIWKKVPLIVTRKVGPIVRGKI